MPRPQPQRRPDSAQISIASDLKLVKLVRRFVTDQCQSAGFEQRQLDEIALAVSELCDNAIEHGSGRDDAQIHVEVRQKPDRVRIVVRDSGNHDEATGRLQEAVLQMEDLPPAEAIRGRGLFLINSLVDEIAVQHLPDGGTEIAIEKRK